MRTVFAFLLMMLGYYHAFACSTFFISHNGQMVFGRNYDWVAGSGLVCTNHRGLFKTSYKVSDGAAISWTSRYGSLTFNQYGKEFPTGGMNEKGLVVELMWLDETVYPRQDARPAIGVLQWIQYQLDNSATIDDVIASDRQLRITSTSTPLHYLVADSRGQAATIEFLDGQMVVHKGEQLSFPVLTNSVYAQSAEYAKRALSGNGNSNGDNSIARFVKACSMVRNFQSGRIQTPLVDHAFNTLESVRQGDHTKWSIVYDITNLKVHFRTLSAPEIKNVSLSSFNFSCAQQAMAIDMNQDRKDDIRNFFTPFTEELNSKLIRESAQLSGREVKISTQTQQALITYPAGIRCK